MAEDNRVVVIRFGHDYVRAETTMKRLRAQDPDCMTMDETLYGCVLAVRP